MTQPPHDIGYLDYGTSANRSPSSSRTGYGGAFGAGMSLPRQSQRPFDAPLGSSALYPADRLAGGYNPRGMDNMPQAGGMPGYMLDNGQAWNYNTSGAATVNGAINGPNRNRSVNRRAALPQVRHFGRESEISSRFVADKWLVELDRPQRSQHATFHAILFRGPQR